MKLSIVWIFDHINADWRDMSLSDLVNRFNTTTAEIEGFERVTFDLKPFTSARVTDLKKDTVILYSDEWNKEITLPKRSDGKIGSVFLITKDRYATVRDLGCYKDGFVPSLMSDKNLLSGVWKKQFEVEDYILDIDNKSITHRPDMWSHRGFAREIAALFDLKLKDEKNFFADHAVKHYERFAPSTEESPCSIEIKNQEACSWFAGLYIQSITMQPSALWMAHRIARTDNRPINAIVDVTNYVLLDLGQPMHAFDVKKIGTRTIIPRFAKKGEKLQLLDGEIVELTADDFVITNGSKPIALAGIMGGIDSGIEDTTLSLFIEAACFDAATIRRSSVRFSKRTESSARFEKSLDAQQTVPAMLRMLQLLRDMNVSMNVLSPIITVGHKKVDKKIQLSHSMIEGLLGCTIEQNNVISILKKLAFKVEMQDVQGSVLYSVTVPSFRATKDITIPEDIVEEVGRFYGYTNIVPELPAIKMQPSDMQSLYTVRKIKQHMAYALAMHEVHNYALYDEEFLKRLEWRPTKSMEVINPVSENWKRLVTSLIPHLLKNIHINELKEDDLRFFEWNPVWPDGSSSTNKISETPHLAAVIYNRKQIINFYQAKEKIQSLFDLLDLDISWVKVSDCYMPWYSLSQTAQLVHDKRVIGYAGMVDNSFLGRIAEGNAFIMEIDGQYIASYSAPTHTFQSLSKYQDVSLDISLLVPLDITVQHMEQLIKHVDPRIVFVKLIDFFEKEEWEGKRSLTFRFIIRDHEKTMEKNDIDAVHQAVIKKVEKQGVSVR